MSILHHSIKINAPLDKVWAVLTDLEQVANYNPLVNSAKYTSAHKTGVGSSRYCEFKPSGFADEQVTALKEKEFISMEITNSNWPLVYMKWTNYLSQEGNETTLKTVTEFKPKFGILGWLMDKLMMKPKFNKVLKELFISLKQYVELK